MTDLDEQDEIKEQAIKWLLESDYVVRAVEGTIHARGHLIRKQEQQWHGPSSTVKMEVQLKHGTTQEEAQALIDLVQSFSGLFVRYSTEMNDHGRGFATEPNRLEFEMQVPSRRNSGLTTYLQYRV